MGGTGIQSFLPHIWMPPSRELLSFQGKGSIRERQGALISPGPWEDRVGLH